MHFKRYTKNITGFVLMEVIVSMLIIGIALSVILRSFNTSADSNVRTQISTTALFLIQKMLFEIDFNSDEYKNGTYEGSFGDDYPNFYWRITSYEYEPEYDDVTLENDIEETAELKDYKIDIVYNDQRGRYFIPISLKTSALGAEKFSYASIQSQIKYN